MKKNLFNFLMAAIVLLMPKLTFGQAPNLGTCANFVLFSSAGAVTNSGIPHLTHLTGNVGTNSGSSTGFGNVDGGMHDNDGVTATCAADLLTAYAQLNTAIPTFFPAPLLGGGTTLVAGVYHISSAATMSGDLILDGMGDPNAVFIFQIQGAFATAANSKVKLINGTVACNVFWKVEGLVSLASGTTMRGTIVAHNAAINISVLDTLEGRALSIAGAVTTNALLAYTPVGCGSPVLTGPAAPALVSTAAYGIFSSIGPVMNTGITYVTGDVGTNSGLTTGFNPLFVTGMIHPTADGSTAACAADLGNVYTYLNALPVDIDLLYPAQFGNDLVLTPHTYNMGGAATFTGNVYLNAEGNSNAVFVIKISGALTTTTFSKVILMNGAQAKNVYWKVSGATLINDNSIFNGTIVGTGAITLNTGDSMSGRAMTINGAVNINASYVAITTASVSCVAPAIGGTKAVCAGSATTLTDASVGGTWASSNTAVAAVGSSSGVVNGITGGTATITYYTTAGCTSTAAVTVNQVSAITGAGSVCTGGNITLSNATPGGTWSSSNTTLATAGTSSGIITGIASGTPVISYNLPGACSATKTITVGASGGTITGLSTVCSGSSIVLTDNMAGGAWSASNAKAMVTGGIVTGVTAGVDTIMYTATNACGTTTATKTVTVETLPNAGSISGLSTVCAGTTITLTDPATGGVWSSSNGITKVSPAGVVTGLAMGTSTISYTVTNSCGAATATKTVTVGPLADEGSIAGAASVCASATTILTESVTGGVWSSSNAKATVSGGLVTGITAGSTTISYTVTNSCGAASAMHNIIINALADAGSISGAASVCAGSAVTLTDITGGGIWSSSNPAATVSGGVVMGVSSGIAIISYTATNLCGSVSALKAITVNPVLIPAVSLTGIPSGIICSGTPVTISAIPVNGGIAPVYSWKVKGFLTSVTGNSYTYYPANADVVTATLHSNATCATPDSAMQSVTMLITPSVMPSITVTAIPGNVVCNGVAVTYNASYANGGSLPSMVWMVNGVSAGSAPAISFTPMNKDSIYTILTSNAVCRQATTVKSNVVAMIVEAGLIPVVNIYPVNGTILELGKTDSFVALVTDGGVSPLYQWFVNNVAATGASATSDVFITSKLKNNDSVSCMVKSSGICGFTSFNGLIVKVYPAGVVNISAEKTEISVIPNPNNGTFTMSGTLAVTIDQEASVTVTDVTGRIVYSNKIVAVTGKINEQVHLGDNLVSGLYMLSVKTATENSTVHFVVKK